MTNLRRLKDALSQIQGREAVESHLRQVLAPLSSYDRNRGTDLVHTLITFVQFRGSIKTTADKLFLHRNSVSYRLQRIEEVCDFNIKEPATQRLLATALSLTNPKLLDEF